MVDLPSPNVWIAIAEGMLGLGTGALPFLWRIRDSFWQKTLVLFGLLLLAAGAHDAGGGTLAGWLLAIAAWATLATVFWQRQLAQDFFSVSALNALIVGSHDLNPFIVAEVDGNDLRVLYVSPSAEAYPLRPGDLMAEKMPRHRVRQGYHAEPLLDTYLRVAREGAAWAGEAEYDNGQDVRGVFRIVASPLGRDRVFVGWQDISEDREWRDGRSLLIEAQQALIQGHLALWYQPIVCLESGRTVGWEGLIRWPQTDGSTRNPGDFIPLLNRAGLAAPLFWETVEQALAHLQALDDGYVAVNLDPEVIEDAQFPHRVAAMCDRYGVERDRLCLELTESSALALPLIPKLEAARGQGNRVAIDDFGTGYAGYGGLIRLRSVVSILKLDRTMVAEIHRDPTRQDILRSVVVLAHSLGFALVAEGIESEQERRWLQATGCDCGQGYLFGHPAPP